MNRLPADMPNLLDLAEMARAAEFPATSFSIAADDRVEIGLCSDERSNLLNQMSVCADEMNNG